MSFRLRNRVVMLALFMILVIYLWSPQSDSTTGSQSGEKSTVGSWTGKYFPKFGSASGSPQQPELDDTHESHSASDSSSVSTKPVLASTTRHSVTTPSAEPATSASVGEPLPSSTDDATPVSESPSSNTGSSTETPQPTPTPKLQDEFRAEHDRLGLNESAVGLIYGTTLNTLVDQKPLEPSVSILKPADSQILFTDSRPHTYNPYPDYNSKTWKAANKGEYVVCDGWDGPIKDDVVFVGHSEAFANPHIGSYKELNIDNNICFERQTRLGPVGHLEEDEIKSNATDKWSKVNWGELQTKCVEKNAGRFAPPVETKAPGPEYSNEKARRGDAVEPAVKPRTAVLWRSWSGRTFTEDDKQTIRSLIVDLTLRTGGEYQVYLLVHIKDETLPIWTDPKAYEAAIHDNVPEEFWNIVVLWTEGKMRERYPNIRSDTVNVHQAQYLPLQKFAEEFPQYEYFWNWETDVRYTGNHYDLVEKLTTFANAQPRKYLWERNERYYIPSYHGDYDTLFRQDVEMEFGKETIWGAVPLKEVTPTGPTPPVKDPKDDNYEWGVGEEADHISLMPIFDPVKTGWVIRDDMWGYQGLADTPRRTAIGTHSRSSRRLLNAMHIENEKGNHIASEMCAPTLSFLHGLKAVFAPIPMFFDRPWGGESLNRYFNPGPKGVSGSAEDAPYTFGHESRYAGSTWYYRATPPQRLYNHWLGWQDDGIGGPEWEKVYGRPCLPPLLLHPIKDVQKPPPDFSSSSSA